MQERVKLTVFWYIFLDRESSDFAKQLIQRIAFDAINLNNNNQCINVGFLVFFFEKETNYCCRTRRLSVRLSVRLCQ